jgi:hypothetical protein
VTYADQAVCDEVLKKSPHQLDGRTIDPKLAVPRGQESLGRGPGGPGGGGGGRMQEQKTKKIFVGGLTPTTDEAKLKEYFSE